MRRENFSAVLSEIILQTDHAARYANRLLSDLGESIRVHNLADHPAIAFRRSGLLDITRLMLPVSLASHADGALMALKALSKRSGMLPQTGSQLLGERARYMGLVRHGNISAGGYGRLLKTSDGQIALNLVRDEDWGLIPAWLEATADSWEEIERIVSGKETLGLVARASEIGLPVGLNNLPSAPHDWFRSKSFEKANCEVPLVVDLSGLWAGPLASSLLGLMGAKVIKVESRSRPDGMRLGNAEFYALINAGKDCVSFDFSDQDDLKRLKQLLHKADVVIEASRPRALRQLGIVAEDFVSKKPGKIWARLTAYGRTENRIGFGDDIGVSAGLTYIMEKTHNESCFVGDAIADPMNALHVALAIQSGLNQGGGSVIDFSMCDVLRYAIGDLPNNIVKTSQHWRDLAAQDDGSLYPIRSPFGDARNIGADNAVWL